MAQFHDAASEINDDYDEHSYITEEMSDGFDERIANYINNPERPIPDGDILFVGSDVETRQEYGFGIVCDGGKFRTSEDVEGRGYKGIEDLARRYGQDQVDYTDALPQVRDFCKQMGMSCASE